MKILAPLLLFVFSSLLFACSPKGSEQSLETQFVIHGRLDEFSFTPEKEERGREMRNIVAKTVESRKVDEIVIQDKAFTDLIPEKFEKKQIEFLRTHFDTSHNPKTSFYKVRYSGSSEHGVKLLNMYADTLIGYINQETTIAGFGSRVASTEIPEK